MEEQNLYDVLIIGSGPAALTAAIYTSRANLKTLLIGGASFGGQLMITTDVEDYPGFPDGITGPELIFKMRDQAEKFGAQIKQLDATVVNLEKSPFTVTTDEGDFKGKTLIIATGASAKWLGLENETRLIGRGVSACAVCDGAFFRDKKVVVVGGGDTAMKEALFLTKFADVTVIHRRDSLTAFPIWQERAKKNPKIKFIWDTVVEDVLGENNVTGVKLKNIKTGATSTLETNGLFVAIGHIPNTAIFKDKITIDSAGYVVPEAGTRTNVDGVFVAGDVHDHKYKQAITAAGSGCKAALDVEDYLTKQNNIHD
jgi:thioredoxin reductase (NADPH)